MYTIITSVYHIMYMSNIVANLIATLMLLCQDAFSENAQHLQKVLIAYLDKRGKSDPACAVSVVLYCIRYIHFTESALHLHTRSYVSVCP